MTLFLTESYVIQNGSCECCKKANVHERHEKVMLNFRISRVA